MSRHHHLHDGSLWILRAILVPVVALLSSWGCVQESPQSSVDQAVGILLKLLQDEHADMRRTAVESLGKIGDQSAVAAVMTLMDDPSPVVRRAAVKTSGRIGSGAVENVVPHLIRALEDTDGEVRRTAAEAIGELEPPIEQLPPLFALLSSQDVRVRRAAILALVSLDFSKEFGALDVALQDRDPTVRQGAVAALGETGLPEAAAKIHALAIKDVDPSVRAEAVYRLGRFEGEEIRLILKRIGETDRVQAVRRWAQPKSGFIRGSD